MVIESKPAYIEQATVARVLDQPFAKKKLESLTSCPDDESTHTMASQTNGVSNGTSMQEILLHHDPMKPFDWPKEEEKVLELWKELDAFKESLRQSEGRKPYSFYDGPVSTATCRSQTAVTKALTVSPTITSTHAAIRNRESTSSG